MKQILFRIIYNGFLNKILRNINKIMAPILPEKVKLAPSGIIKIRSSEGKTLKIKTNQTSYLTHLLFWEGYLNHEYTEIFIKLIKKINTFYDIGANIGYYSLLAETENKNIKVVGFEPATGPLFYFRENVTLNKFKNIRIESLALSHMEGEIVFYEIKNKKYSYLKYNLSGEGNAGSKTQGRNYVPNTLQSTTLNQYIQKAKEISIDLIKIDTEGTEHLILKKSDIILREMKPIVICETLYNRIEPDLEKVFNLHGYDFYNHTENGLVKVSSIIRDHDNGIRNCFFVHPSKFHLIEEFVNNS